MNKLLLILFFLPILGFGQGDFFWSHTGIYYKGVEQTVNVTSQCEGSGIGIGTRIMYIDNVFENYQGVEWDSLMFISIDGDYDAFDISEDGFYGDAVVLPFTIDINGKTDNDYVVDVDFRYRYINPTPDNDICDTSGIEEGHTGLFYFKIKDVTGNWGEIMFVTLTYYNE